MPTLPVGEVLLPSFFLCSSLPVNGRNGETEAKELGLCLLKGLRSLGHGIRTGEDRPIISTPHLRLGLPMCCYWVECSDCCVRAEKPLAPRVPALRVRRGPPVTQSIQLHLGRGGSPATHIECLAKLPPVKHEGSATGSSVRERAELDRLCDEGHLDRALDVLLRIDLQGTVPSTIMYKVLLKACAKRKALVYAKRVHAHLAQYGLESNRSLGQCLVSALAKCGGLDDALKVLQRLPHRSASSWTAIISGYANSGQGQEALNMYQSMQEEGLEPNRNTLISLLKACVILSDLKVGKRIHAEALKYGYGTDLIVGTCLVDMYAKCGSIVHAQDVFDGLAQHDVVSWNVMLAAYAQRGQTGNALQLYRKMREEGATPDHRTFVSMLQACGMIPEKEAFMDLDGQSINVDCLQMEKAIHFDAWMMGYSADFFVSNTLISVYGKCGSILDAKSVFDSLSHRDEVSWTAMLSAYIQQGEAEQALHLCELMLEEGVRVDNRTILTMLQVYGMLAVKDESGVVDGCFMKVKCLEMGKVIHADAHRKGYDSDIFVCSALVSMYGKCGSTVDAQNVFEGCPQHDVVSWNAMQTAYIEQGEPEKAIQLYEQMRIQDLTLDDRTFVNALQACGMLADKEEDEVVDGQLTKLKALEKGKAIHAKAWAKGYGSDVFIGSALIILYGKCRSMRDVKIVFDALPQYDVATWTAMLAAYVEDTQAEQCLLGYGQMREEGILPTCRSFVIALQACGILAVEEEDIVLNGDCIKLKSLERCKALHADIRKMGYESDLLVANTLINVYGRCGTIVDAWDVFKGLSRGDVVSWTAMLAAYAHQGQGEMALQLYKQMHDEGICPNRVTFVCMLQVCGAIGRLDICKEVHDTLASTRNCMDPLLANSLIHAYGRCASMVDAEITFRTIPEPDVVAWTTLIAGYARQGNCAASMQCYEEMQLAGVKPDKLTFLCLISACSHAGQVDKGVEYLESMSRDHGITPVIEHYVAIVDLLGRAGYFTKAEELISNMPVQPNVSLWLCLLGACRNHGKVSLGKQAFDYVIGLQPQHSAAYLLMSNIYLDAGLWDHAKEVMESRQKEGAWKKPGQTWIDHDHEVHTFTVHASDHPQQEHLYDLSRQVGLKLQEIAEIIPA